MVSTTIGPGKTVPRLWADLALYDPLEVGRNTLCEVPLPKQTARTREPHKHVWTKRAYGPTSVPAEHSPPLPNRVYSSRGICEECRAQLHLVVDLTRQSPSQNRVCPNDENPLHHLRYDPSRSTPVNTDRARGERWEDKRVFFDTCSGCPLVLTISIKSPLIDSSLRHKLTDKNLLQRRIDRALGGPGHTLPPSKTLETLGQYLKNVIGGDQRKIPAENTRFKSCFLDECDDVFAKAHFTQTLGDDGSIFWTPPPLEDGSSTVRDDLSDMLEETTVLFDRLKPVGTDRKRPNAERVDKEVKQMLSFEKYDCLTQWVVDLSTTEPAEYPALGAVNDFAEDLLIWAYKRQRDCDPPNTTRYLDCLETISNARQTEKLQMALMMEKSTGAITTRDIDEAFKSLEIDPSVVEEDMIVSAFQSRVADAPALEAQLRESLVVIGKARNSKLLLDAARRTVNDLDAAYRYLEVGDSAGSVGDDTILSMYQWKINENPADEPTARDALRLIAETRQSNVLLHFLESDVAFEAPFTLEDAYQRLSTSKEDDDDMLIAVYKIRIGDAPGQLSDLRAALRTIAEARDSVKLKQFLQEGESGKPIQTYTTPKGSADWPVGLENIGNTCYLNSLLQFYFTVKPLRDMVLDFEAYQETEVTHEVVERKKVGGRKVSRREIERSKRFALELRKLFQSLITADTSYVKPERELAQLALFSSKDEAEEEVRRMSMAETGPPTITIDDDPSHTQEDRMDLDPNPLLVDLNDTPDNISESTLVNEESMSIDPVAEKEEDFIMIDGVEKSKPENKENMPPSNTNSSFGSQRRALENLTMNETEDRVDKTGEAYHPPQVPLPPTPPPEYSESAPDRPPPIPPRPQRQSTQMDINIDERRQQDVTECIGNVMFQLEAAVKPVAHEEDGEQIDLIKKLFYGKTRQTLAFPNSNELRTKEELFQNLIVNVADGDSDIYSALDEQFDVEQIELEGNEAKRFLSIRELPPILQIQIQRVQFNRETGMAYKSDSQLSFPETIYMDRYIDTEDGPLRKRREDTWEWKARYRALKARKDDLAGKDGLPDMATTLEHTQEWLEEMDTTEDSLEFDRSLYAVIPDRVSTIKSELKDIDEQMGALKRQINCQFTDLRQFGYRVHAVFIHSGTASGGHYWIYIYDFQKKIFRKYNDDHVDEVKDQQEVFTHANVMNPPTPYFMVFVREDQSETITEAVMRRIKKTGSEAGEISGASEGDKRKLE